MTLAEEYKNQALWREWDSYIGKLPVQSNDTIIEIGCSVGTVTGKLAQKAKHVIGIDNNPELLSEAIKSASAGNISFKLADARSLNNEVLPLADGIWSSFVAAYLPDFFPVLKSWLQLLKPDGWIALVEMCDLFGHEPLSKPTQKLIKNYCFRQRNSYDFEMGSKLLGFATMCGLSIIHDENMYDPELAFDGPASPAILSAWESRFERMTMFRQFFGETKFKKIKKEFLECLSSNDHTSRATVRFIIARKNSASPPV